MSIIKVNNLSKSFSYYEKEVGFGSSIKNLFHREHLLKDAVKDISFEIDRGEIVGFLGPNGAGKTTTLKMLSGILYPTVGTATVMGYIPWERKKHFKMQISIVMGQKSQLWPDLPANESLFLNKCIYEIEDNEYKKIIDELSELLEVKDLMKVQVRRLSLGERMKLELIAALIHKPKLMLLDEPTIGLDITSQRKIREFIKYHNQQTKTTVLITSHYMKDIEELSQRSIVINKGQKVYDGELAKVNEIFNMNKLIKIRLSDYVNKNQLEQFGYIRNYDGFNATLEVDKDNIKRHSKEIMDTLPTLDLNIEDIPIEEGVELLYKKVI